MSVFADTSGLYALLDVDDPNHERAAALWTGLLETEVILTHNYVLLETAALVQRRLGLGAVGDLLEVLAPALDIRWVDEQLHEAGVRLLLAEHRRRRSLVDNVSFAGMREAGIARAFAFDGDFRAAGFELIGS